MESNEDHVVEPVDAIATLEAALAEREKELSEVIVSEEEAGRKLETIETEVSTLRTRLQQVMVDRFDARLLLTQNDAQSLREHASLDGTGVVVSSVEQEDLDLSSEENILNAERYRSLPGTRWFIDDEKSDDEQPAPTQGIASPPTDANGEDVTDEWAHVASTTPPSWLWFDVDAQTTPRVPQHIQTHAAICAAAKRVREEGGQADFIWRVRHAKKFPFLKQEHGLYPFYTLLRSRPDIKEEPPPQMDAQRLVAYESSDDGEQDPQTKRQRLVAYESSDDDGGGGVQT